LFGFLRANPHFLTGITFILMQDQIPLTRSNLLALSRCRSTRPCSMRWNRQLLITAKSNGFAAGLISGSARLMNGMTVPVVFPDLRGMYMWRAAQLLEAAVTFMLALHRLQPTKRSWSF